MNNQCLILLAPLHFCQGHLTNCNNVSRRHQIFIAFSLPPPPPKDKKKTPGKEGGKLNELFHGQLASKDGA